MLKGKIVHLKKIYKFYFDHCLIKCTVFVSNEQNVNLNFSDSLRRTKKMYNKKWGTTEKKRAVALPPGWCRKWAKATLQI